MADEWELKIHQLSQVSYFMNKRLQSAQDDELIMRLNILAGLKFFIEDYSIKKRACSQYFFELLQ